MDNNSAPLEVSVETVHQMRNEQTEHILLDCREQSEFEIAKIEGATLLPMSEITQRVEEIMPHQNDRMVVYCHHGVRSMQVTNWLRANGFTNVSSMAGGIDAWSNAIDPSVAKY